MLEFALTVLIWIAIIFMAMPLILLLVGLLVIAIFAWFESDNAKRESRK